MLIERKGARRAALYFPFKETRGHHFLAPLFRHLGRLGAGGLSFAHITECLAEAPEVAEFHTFDIGRPSWPSPGPGSRTWGQLGEDGSPTSGPSPQSRRRSPYAGQPAS
jgi:hypothetical protein